MKEEYITGGSGTSYMVFTEELDEESLAANEVYRLEIKIAKERTEPYIFSCQASFDTEALYYTRRIHSEKTELDLKEQWKRSCRSSQAYDYALFLGYGDVGSNLFVSG